MIYESQHDKSISIPQYDKSAHSGQGDRVPYDQWKVVEGNIDLVIVEGWMLGYQKVASEDEKLQEYGEQMQKINENMEIYEKMWHPFFDSSILIGIQDPETVYTWRE